MENKNINTNATDTQMNSTNESKSESFANEALTANTNYGTISSADIENGTAELVLIPPFEGDDGGISIACVEGTNESQVIELPINELKYGSAYVDETEPDDEVFRHTLRCKFTTGEAGSYYIRTTKNAPNECLIYSDSKFTQVLSNNNVLNVNGQISIKANLDGNKTYYLKMTFCESGTLGILISSHDTEDVCVADLNNADPNDIDSEGRLIIYSMPNNSLTEGTVSSGTELKLHTFYPRDDEWYYVEGDFLKNGQTVHDWGWCKGKYLDRQGVFIKSIYNGRICVRSMPDPDNDHNKLGHIETGECVRLLGKNYVTACNYTWHKVFYNNQEGYVVAGNITPNFEFTTIKFPFFRAKASQNPNHASEACLSFIISYETFYETEGDDGFGNPTIGYGHKIKDGENFTTITEDEALQLLREDIASFETMVTNYSNERNTSWTQQEFDAFVSLAYNAGGNVRYVMDKILNGFNLYDAFSIIRYSGGNFVLGLYRRRMDEADIFVSGTYQREYERLL